MCASLHVYEPGIFPVRIYRSGYAACVYAHLRLILITFYVPTLASAGCFHIFIRFVVELNEREL